MAVRWIIALSALACAAPAPAQEQQQQQQEAALPAPVQAMVDDVFANGSDAEIAAVVKYARRAAPASAETLDARLALHAAQRPAVQLAASTPARPASPAPRPRWSGRGEIGASRASGNIDMLGAYVSLNAARQGPRWRHALRGEAAYQETNGVRSQERLLLAYEPRYRVSDRLSAYGLLQAEHDPVLGYDARYSVSAGLGYAVVRSERLSVDLQGGPAFRHVQPVAGPDENGLSGRAALDARLRVRPGLALTQTGSAFLDTRGNSFAAATGLEAQLIGQLAARVSYNIQHESVPAAGRVATDTQSRITLVYGF